MFNRGYGSWTLPFVFVHQAPYLLEPPQPKLVSYVSLFPFYTGNYRTSVVMLSCAQIPSGWPLGFFDEQTFELPNWAPSTENYFIIRDDRSGTKPWWWHWLCLELLITEFASVSLTGPIFPPCLDNQCSPLYSYTSSIDVCSISLMSFFFCVSDTLAKDSRNLYVRGLGEQRSKLGYNSEIIRGNNYYNREEISLRSTLMHLTVKQRDL